MQIGISAGGNTGEPDGGEREALETCIGEVRGCVCHRWTFAELRVMCEGDTDAIPSVKRQTGCGSSCGLCNPYVRAAVQQGLDTLPVMWPADFEAMGIRPGALSLIDRDAPDSSSEQAG